MACARVVDVEQLESRELHRFALDEIVIRPQFHFRRAESVHIHHDLHFGQRLDILGMRDHGLREPMHHKDLRRQIVLPDQARKVLCNVVDILGIE